jgi:hypothetical protein
VIEMSRAFLKENDDMWLHEIAPTLGALLNFLTKENNGIRVVEEKRTIDARGREVFHMTNGLAYVKNEEGRWSVAPVDE